MVIGTIGPPGCSSVFVRRPTEDGRPLGISEMPFAGPVTVRICVSTLPAAVDVTVWEALISVMVTVEKAGVGRTIV